MANSRNIAGLIGPSLIAITIFETVNIHIWAGNTAAGVHFNGAVLLFAGLAVVRESIGSDSEVSPQSCSTG